MGKSKKAAAVTRAKTKSVGRNTSSKQPAVKEQTVAPEIAHASSVTPSLEQLQRKLGERDQELEARFIGALSEDALVALGANYASNAIYETVPAVVDSWHVQWAKMDAARRASLLGFAPSLLAGIVARAIELRTMEQQGIDLGTEGTRARLSREARYRAVARAAVARRDHAYVAVRELLPQQSPERVRWEKAVGTAETPDELHRGITNVTTELQTLLADDRHGSLLRKLNLGDSTVEALVQSAASVKEAGEAVKQVNAEPKVLQRALDLEDGKTLRLVQAVYRVWKEAAKNDALLRVPPMGPLARLVQRAQKKGEDAPVDDLR